MKVYLRKGICNFIQLTKLKFDINIIFRSRFFENFKSAEKSKQQVIQICKTSADIIKIGIVKTL